MIYEESVYPVFNVRLFCNRTYSAMPGEVKLTLPLVCQAPQTTYRPGTNETPVKEKGHRSKICERKVGGRTGDATGTGETRIKETKPARKDLNCKIDL